MNVAVITFAVVLAALSPLSAETKLEKSLKADNAGQALTITDQTSTIADLRAQLAAAHIQTATANGATAAANGAASGSGAAIVDLKSQLAVAHSETAQANGAVSGSTKKVNDLQSQLAEAHAQTAIATGVALGTQATLKARRVRDFTNITNGSTAAREAAQSASEAVRLGRENHAALLDSAKETTRHTASIAELQHGYVGITRLLVIMCIVLLAQVPALGILLAKFIHVRRDDFDA